MDYEMFFPSSNMKCAFFRPILENFLLILMLILDYPPKIEFLQLDFA